jgi:hypothetical protein
MKLVYQRILVWLCYNEAVPDQQAPRPDPVVPDQKRPHGHISRTHQIRMQPVLALLVVTEKEQSFLWAVLLAPIAAHRTGLRGIIRIYFDRERSRQRRLVADERMQFSKGPLRIHPIGFAGLWGHPLKPFAVFLAFALSALRALSNIGKLF